MDPAAGKGLLESRRQSIAALHTAAIDAVRLGVGDEVGVAEGHAEIGKAVRRLLPADHPVGVVLQDQHHEIHPNTHRGLQLLRVHHEAAVATNSEHASRWIEHRSHNGRGQPGSHRCERVVEQEGVGNASAVVAGEPDLVHAIVEADDSVFQHDLAHIVHYALRRQRITAFLRPFGYSRENLLAQRQERPRPRQLAFETVGQQRQARTDIPDKLRMREVHLLDRGGQITHMQDPRSARPHQERRFLHRIVADRDDQIGAIDRLVNMVALGQRRGAHVEPGSAGDGALPNLRVEEGDFQALHEL
jgi:hypothetical protein